MSDLDTEALAAQVVAAVERLLEAGRTGRVEIHVHGPTQHVTAPITLMVGSSSEMRHTSQQQPAPQGGFGPAP